MIIGERQKLRSAQEIHPTHSQQRSDLIGRLKKVIRERKSWDKLEALLLELEELL